VNISDLPETKLLVLSLGVEDLSRAIDSVQHTFSCFDIITEGPRSGRILFNYYSEGAASFPSRMTAEEIAVDLVNVLRLQSRYEPKPLEFANKGWEVHSADIKGQHAVIVWAAWVPIHKLPQGAAS
jgi:hypothetical protein